MEVQYFTLGRCQFNDSAHTFPSLSLHTYIISYLEIILDLQRVGKTVQGVCVYPSYRPAVQLSRPKQLMLERYCYLSCRLYLHLQDVPGFPDVPLLFGVSSRSRVAFSPHASCSPQHMGVPLSFPVSPGPAAFEVPARYFVKCPDLDLPGAFSQQTEVWGLRKECCRGDMPFSRHHTGVQDGHVSS